MASPAADPTATEDTLSVVEGITAIVNDPATLAKETALAKEFLMTHGANWGEHLLSALLVLLAGRWLVKKATHMVRKVLHRAHVDEALITFITNVLFTLGLIFVVITALSQLGVNTTSLAAMIAAAGLAIGLALQSSLSNLAAGVMIIVFRPFRRGDYVEIAGTAGSVLEVNMFTTTLTSPDNKRIIVPNNTIIANHIINYSAMATRRIDLVFSVSYDDDLRKVRAVLQDVLLADARILHDPEPVIAVDRLADFSVNFVCRPWVKSADYWPVLWDLTENVKLRFDAEGITIPFPQNETRMIYVNEPKVA